MTKRLIVSLAGLILWAVVLVAQSPIPTARYVTYLEVQPLLQLMDEIAPPALKGKSAAQQAQLWPDWVKAQDAQLRARLQQGDEDTLINFLLFGTSFTRQPRVSLATVNLLKSAREQAEREGLIGKRLDDLLTALQLPGGNERLMFLRKLVTLRGQQATPAGRAKLKNYLLTNLKRVLAEQESLAKTIEAARLQGNAGEEFIERSKLYRNRGLSLDTTLQPNFAIEQSLQTMLAHGLIKRGSISRVAVIGPGLDFTDKAAGYDFYPQQTLQPFALLDTLLRLGLAKPEDLQLTAFDVSPRIHDHLAQARQRAQRGLPYVVQLPLDSTAQWKPEMLAYWQGFGVQIGKPVAAGALPSGLASLQMRAVAVQPQWVRKISSTDLNVVWQRADASTEAVYDLIVATNILVYYDVFEQSLALSNLQSLLRPGGVLLSNNALLELPVLKMRSVGYQTTVYSDRADDGDHIVWYQRML